VSKPGKGFFALSSLMGAKKSLPLIANCQACGLHAAGCSSPFMKPLGDGTGKVMIVGEFPDRLDDSAGFPFSGGQAARRVRTAVAKAGLDSDKDVIWTNALTCSPGDRVRNPKSIEYCRPNLLKAIETHKPRAVVLLGLWAIKSLVGFLWKEDVGEVARWVGWRIPCQRYNAWVCPTYAPDQLLNKNHPVMDLMFDRDVRWACHAKKAPWKEVPRYKDQVRVVFDPDEAAETIRAMTARVKRPVAFDYETNMLKPESDRSKIVCCSVSDGETTIAFPWVGSAVKAMKAFFKSDVPKIASNMKFEDRWTRAVVGVEVRNWFLDTMLAAHVLDNRPNITSIKFQAFVHLGQESYDDHVKPFLKSKDPGGYGENRIDEVDPRDLMTYCALDSLLEWKVALRQHKEFAACDSN
jgi:uracil-DNA glycosylase family 4